MSDQYFSLKSFTAGKAPDRNEDAFGFNASTIVLADGATDKTTITYGQAAENDTYKTGGEIAADIAIRTTLASNLNGEELAHSITKAMQQYYAKHTPQALQDSAYRFASVLVVARVIDSQLIVTQIGDVAFRVNGHDEYTNDKEIDEINANIRKKYAEETGDTLGSREHILPRLKNQHRLQNNNKDPLGYGALDGSPIPDKFIRTFSFPLTDIRTLEIATDGYFGVFPKEATIEAYEKLHAHIEAVDPYKIGEFASTKVSDDRTVLIATFKQ